MDLKQAFVYQVKAQIQCQIAENNRKNYEEVGHKSLCYTFTHHVIYFT